MYYYFYLLFVILFSQLEFEVRLYTLVPLGVEDGEICRVPIPPLDNHVLSEYSFLGKAQLPRGRLGWLIQVIFK